VHRQVDSAHPAFAEWRQNLVSAQLAFFILFCCDANRLTSAAVIFYQKAPKIFINGEGKRRRNPPVIVTPMSAPAAQSGVPLKTQALQGAANEFSVPITAGGHTGLNLAFW